MNLEVILNTSENENLDRSYAGIIKAWFNYNDETGEITWKDWVSDDWYTHKKYHARFLNERAGKRVAFYKLNTGHLEVSVAGKTGVRAHLIVWVLKHGSLPENQIDHIDGDVLNNRPENLRDVPNYINGRNKRISSHNSSGFTGVCLNNNKTKWRARIEMHRKEIHLGTFDTLEDAVKARERFLEENKHLGFTARHGK